jgi:2,3-bisphosphoglycerate-dependent phosphoglycerate mutase
MANLVLLRHGQSAWNQANQFTGWMDIDLTSQGAGDARRAGRFLREAGLEFDQAHTSLLTRAIRSLWLALDEMDRAWLPVAKDWRLNERHYGALQGLNKAEIAQQYGLEQVYLWRRSFGVRPPQLDWHDPRHPRFDRRYASIDSRLLPSGESLYDTYERVLQYWAYALLPQLQRGKRLLVVAHGNTLRALIKHLDQISDESVPELNVPTAIPIAYQIDLSGAVTSRAYIGDAEVIRHAVETAKKAARV